MSSTLLVALAALSKDLGDYWASTSTSAGAAGGTTVVDSALMAKSNDWLTREAYDFITEAAHAAIYEERKISSFSNTAGTLTNLAHSVQIGSGVDYEVHLFVPPSDKRLALIQACKDAFPSIHSAIKDESLTWGNWLWNGDVEKWTSTSYPDYWRVSAVTAAQNITTANLTRGTSSVKLDTAAGYLYQDQTLNADLIQLRGQYVTFRADGWCDTASCLRLAIYDGIDTTYSDYHAGDDMFNDAAGTKMYVTAQINQQATSVSLRVYHAVAAATSYVDDLRLTGPTLERVYIGDLGLALDQPYRVSTTSDGNRFHEPWPAMHDIVIDSGNYIRSPEAMQDYRIRVEGCGYLDFLASGASSTAWTATVAIDDPQLRILTAQAAVWLYERLTQPRVGRQAVVAQYQAALDWWKAELKERKRRFGMTTPIEAIRW